MREATLWTLHLLAGVVVLVFLGIHMGIMHLESVLQMVGLGYREVLSWTSVAARNKELFFAITYVILLGAALYHGLYGLRNILLELGLGPGASKAVNWVLALVGFALFVVGAVAAIGAYVA